MSVDPAAQTILEWIALAEQEEKERVMATEGPKWDWFGPPCDCPEEGEHRKDDGSCREHPRARDKQKPPPGHWNTWLVLAGRGFGKSRTGAQWIIDKAMKLPDVGRFAIVGQQASDVRDIMVEGESGILACSPPWFKPRYLWSKRKLEWPNGAIGLCYSGEEPGQFRGPQFHNAWCDELMKWPYIEESWDNLQFGLRLSGKDGRYQPQTCVTTTPIPFPFLKKLMKDETTVTVSGSMYENAANLAASFIRTIKNRYEGTRLGLQEIFAKILDDNPGALWSTKLLDDNRRAAGNFPPLIRIVIAIDPSIADPTKVLDEAKMAECGIMVGGISEDYHGFLIEDATIKGSPNDWALAAIGAYHRWRADRIVAETNQGGAMIEALLRSVDPMIPYTPVHASRGKHTRAEPISSLDEQGKIHHCGSYPELEEQMTTWMPGMTPSPDRMDARVWLFTHLMLDGTPLEAGESPWGDWRGS